MKGFSVSAHTMCDTQEQVLQAMNALTRVATGLALDEINVSISIVAVDIEDDE